MIFSQKPQKFRYAYGLVPLSLLLFTWCLHLVAGLPLPKPQVIVRSQSLLYQQQPGRQVDLSHVLPTTELFWLNIEEGYFACQVNSSEKYLKIFRLSRLCDGIVDCYEGSDELGDLLKCSRGCIPPTCSNHGVCLSSTPESQCHCDDGYGGKGCEMADTNECRQSPCSIHAECTNTLGSYFCTCRVGYTGDGFECAPLPESATVAGSISDESSSTTVKDLRAGQQVTLRATATTVGLAAGTASSFIVDGLEEPPRRESDNNDLSNQNVNYIETSSSTETETNLVSEKVTVVSDESKTSSTTPRSSGMEPLFGSEVTELPQTVEKTQSSSATVSSTPDLEAGAELSFETTILPVVTTAVSASVKDNIQTELNLATAVIEPQTTVAPVTVNDFSGFQIPNSVDDVLSNVKIAVDDFIKQHQDDSTDHSLTEEGSQTPVDPSQAFTVPSATTSATEESVISIISVATPDTSNVSGSTNVVNKVKDILSVLVSSTQSPEEQNSTETPLVDKLPEYDDGVETKQPSEKLPEYDTGDTDQNNLNEAAKVDSATAEAAKPNQKDQETRTLSSLDTPTPEAAQEANKSVATTTVPSLIVDTSDSVRDNINTSENSNQLTTSSVLEDSVSSKTTFSPTQELFTSESALTTTPVFNDIGVTTVSTTLAGIVDPLKITTETVTNEEQATKSTLANASSPPDNDIVFPSEDITTIATKTTVNKEISPITTITATVEIIASTPVATTSNSDPTTTSEIEVKEAIATTAATNLPTSQLETTSAESRVEVDSSTNSNIISLAESTTVSQLTPTENKKNQETLEVSTENNSVSESLNSENGGSITATLDVPVERQTSSDADVVSSTTKISEVALNTSPSVELQTDLQTILVTQSDTGIQESQTTAPYIPVSDEINNVLNPSTESTNERITSATPSNRADSVTSSKADDFVDTQSESGTYESQTTTTTPVLISGDTNNISTSSESEQISTTVSPNVEESVWSSSPDYLSSVDQSRVTNSTGTPQGDSSTTAQSFDQNSDNEASSSPVDQNIIDAVTESTSNKSPTVQNTKTKSTPETTTTSFVYPGDEIQGSSSASLSESTTSISELVKAATVGAESVISENLTPSSETAIVQTTTPATTITTTTAIPTVAGAITPTIVSQSGISETTSQSSDLTSDDISGVQDVVTTPVSRIPDLDQSNSQEDNAIGDPRLETRIRGTEVSETTFSYVELKSDVDLSSTSLIPVQITVTAATTEKQESESRTEAVTTPETIILTSITTTASLDIIPETSTDAITTTETSAATTTTNPSTAISEITPVTRTGVVTIPESSTSTTSTKLSTASSEIIPETRTDSATTPETTIATSSTKLSTTSLEKIPETQTDAVTTSETTTATTSTKLSTGLEIIPETRTDTVITKEATTAASTTKSSKASPEKAPKIRKDAVTTIETTTTILSTASSEIIPDTRTDAVPTPETTTATKLASTTEFTTTPTITSQPETMTPGTTTSITLTESIATTTLAASTTAEKETTPKATGLTTTEAFTSKTTETAITTTVATSSPESTTSEAISKEAITTTARIISLETTTRTTEQITESSPPDLNSSTTGSKLRNDAGDVTSEEALEEILKPCADSYMICTEGGLGGPCLSGFEQCSVTILSDKNKTEGIIPDELVETIEQEPKDKELPSSLLQCILDNQNCIELKQLDCMPTYNACSLKALEESRKRRLRNFPKVDEPQIPASRASDETDVEDLSKKLSGNFTSCVQSYTRCTAAATLSSEVSDCVKRFHSCSLELLKNAEVEDKLVPGINLSPLDAPGTSTENTKLSSSLFACIQDYVMCLMRKDQWCMRDYNKCTLEVLDKAKSNETLGLVPTATSFKTEPELSTQPIVNSDHLSTEAGVLEVSTTASNSNNNQSELSSDIETKNDLQEQEKEAEIEQGPGREGSADISDASSTSSSDFSVTTTEATTTTITTTEGASEPANPVTVSTESVNPTTTLTSLVSSGQETSSAATTTQKFETQSAESDISDLPPECVSDGAPPKFGSFSGRPAQSIADCTWDFFGCTNRDRNWPSNKQCCQARFDACCMKVMAGKKKPGQGHEPEIGTTSGPASTTSRPASVTAKPQSPDSPPPQHQNQNPQDKIQLIDCIWNYMGCAKRADKPDSECKEDFNVCSMIAMGMAPPPTDQVAPATTTAATTTTTATTTTRSPINDIDLPELPDFLKPEPSSTGRPQTPIQDIDLPDGFEVVMEEGSAVDQEQISKQEETSEFMQCLLRLYKCQENGLARCPNVELCQKPVEAVVTEPDEQINPDLSTVPIPSVSTTLKPTTAALPQPVSTSGSSDTQCVWAYFSCGKQRSQAECQKRFDACSVGKNPDNEICAEVAENPQNYLVPHPDDCTKFYSCQNLGWKGGWIAHQMDCPPTTGFDVNLRICNYIRALPRCSKEKTPTLFHEVEGIAARQTRNKKETLQVPEFGYLSADRYPEPAPQNQPSPVSSGTHDKFSRLVTSLAIVLSLISALIL